MELNFCRHGFVSSYSLESASSAISVVLLRGSCRLRCGMYHSLSAWPTRIHCQRHSVEVTSRQFRSQRRSQSTKPNCAPPHYHYPPHTGGKCHSSNHQRLADNVSVTDNLQALKAQLIAIVQPADIVLLHDPFFGLPNVPALAIMTHLTELHGTLNRSDFTHLRLQLSLPMTPNESIQDFIGTHQELHEQFATAHQPLSE